MTAQRHESEDWQQLATQHRQAQMAGKVQQISRSGRRGNRLFGGLLLIIGLCAVLLGGWYAVDLPMENLTWRKMRGLLALLAGGFITMGTGLAIWTGQFTKR